MSSNRPFSRSSRQFEDEDNFANVYAPTSYRSNSDGRDGSYESNQRWAMTENLSSSRSSGQRKSVTESLSRSNTRTTNTNTSRSNFSTTPGGKSKSAASTSSKAYRDTNIWGLLEKSYRAPEDGNGSNIPKLYFDGSPSDPHQYHQAVEISSTSAGSSHTSYLKQLEDYLLEKEMDIDEQMNQDKNERMKGRALPSSARSSSTRQPSSSKKPVTAQYGTYAKDREITATSRGTKQAINVTASLEKIGEMTLEELAQLPLDLSDSSHLDIIDSEINAFYKHGYDQPRKSQSSNRKTTMTHTTRSKTVIEPSISLPSRKPPQPQKPKEPVKPKVEVEEIDFDSQPQEESEYFSQPDCEPTKQQHHPELTQAKSSLSLLKSKIKQVSRSARKPNPEKCSGGVDGDEIRTNGSTPVSREEDGDVNNTPARIETEATSRSNFRVPVPVGLKATGRINNQPHHSDSGDDEVDRNYANIRGGRTDNTRSVVPNEKEDGPTSLNNKKQPQSLQDILRQKPQPSMNSRTPSQIEKGGGIRPKDSHTVQDDYQDYEQPHSKFQQQNRGSSEVTGSFSSNPYEQDDFEEEGDDGELPTEECPDCGRKFIPTAFEKHVKICAKVFMQKRKKFDSTKQRLQGEGVDPELKKVYEKSKKEDLKLKRNGGAASQGESKWKQQSSAFREAMKAAREYTKAKERGEEPPPPVISAPDPSLIPCPHCGRRFNEMAANRHIPQCNNIKAKPTSLKRGGGITAAAGAIKPRKY